MTVSIAASVADRIEEDVKVAAESFGDARAALRVLWEALDALVFEGM